MATTLSAVNLPTIDIPLIDALLDQQPALACSELPPPGAWANAQGASYYRVNPGALAALIDVKSSNEAVEVRLGDFALLLFTVCGTLEMRVVGEKTSALATPRSMIVASGEHESILCRDASAGRLALVALFVEKARLRRQYGLTRPHLGGRGSHAGSSVMRTAVSEKPMSEIVDSIVTTEVSEQLDRIEVAARAHELIVHAVDHLNGRSADPAVKSAADHGQDAMVEAAMAIYRERLSMPPKVDDLARRFHTTRALLAKAFQDHLGMTPAQYGRTVRMTWASDAILAKTMSIAAIADKTGYANPAAFSRAFRTTFGHRPKDHAKVTRGGDA